MKPPIEEFLGLPDNEPPKLNGSWPTQTWLQRRLIEIKRRELEEAKDEQTDE